MPPPPPRPAKPGKVTVFRALYAYAAQHSDELSFEEGDMLYVQEQNANGWWKATINGKAGIIPANYVEASSGNAEQLDNPLHDAAKRGNISFLEECLAMKVSPNGLDKAGSTPLHWAARGGHLDCVGRLLSEPGIQINVRNKVAQWGAVYIVFHNCPLNQLGDTPLHGAAWKGHPEIITMLLESGADSSIANEEGKLPADLANDPQCGRLLIVRKVVDSAGYVDPDDDPASD